MTGLFSRFFEFFGLKQSSGADLLGDQNCNFHFGRNGTLPYREFYQ